MFVFNLASLFFISIRSSKFFFFISQLWNFTRYCKKNWFYNAPSMLKSNWKVLKYFRVHLMLSQRCQHQHQVLASDKQFHHLKHNLLFQWSTQLFNKNFLEYFIYHQILFIVLLLKLDILIMIQQLRLDRDQVFRECSIIWKAYLNRR